MAFGSYRNYIIDDFGKPISGVSVSVKLTGTGTDASLFLDRGVTTLTNPFTTEIDGSFVFFASDANRYDIVLTKAGITFDNTDLVDIDVSGTVIDNAIITVKVADGAITDPKVNASGITTRSKLPAAIAYEDEANTFTALNRFKDLELDDQDATPVADRRLRTIDGLIRATDTANVEGRSVSRLSLEQITTSEISAAAGILGSQLSATAGILGGQIAANTITQGNMAANSIGLPQLRTNGGVSQSGVGVGLSIALNDSSFFPSLTSTVGVSNVGSVIMADPVTTLPRLSMSAVAGGVITVRWAYITSSDNPTVWISYDTTGKILAVWMSDDPIDPENSIAGVVAEVGGIKQPTISIPRVDLRILSDLSEIPIITKNRGISKSSSPDREPYRILWETFLNPAREIINRCKINPISKKMILV